MTCPLCGRCHRYKHSTMNYKLWCLLIESRLSDKTHFFPIWEKEPNQYWYDVQMGEKSERREEKIAIMLAKMTTREAI